MARTYKDSIKPRARYLMSFIVSMGNPHRVSRANFWYKRYQELVKEKWVSDWDKHDGIYLSKSQKTRLKENKHKKKFI